MRMCLGLGGGIGFGDEAVLFLYLLRRPAFLPGGWRRGGPIDQSRQEELLRGSGRMGPSALAYISLISNELEGGLSITQASVRHG
jgi:hypothetical protein